MYENRYHVCAVFAARGGVSLSLAYRRFAALSFPIAPCQKPSRIRHIFSYKKILDNMEGVIL